MTSLAHSQPTANRVSAMVAKMMQRLESVAPDKKKGLSDALDMDFSEFARFQTLKSAMMGTALSTEEAQTVYGYLGNAPSVFNGRPLAVKITLTKLFEELLSRRIGGAA